VASDGGCGTATCYCGDEIGVRGDRWVHLSDGRWRCYPGEPMHTEFVAEPDPMFDAEGQAEEKPRA
jgi:hypothetical protein